MIKDTLDLMDELIMAIKTKDNSQSYFPLENLMKFEFKFFLLLDIVRYELQLNQELSDSTADAVSLLFVNYALQYYGKDYPYINNICSNVHSKLCQLNKKLKNWDLHAKLGFEDIDIVRYYKKKIKELLIGKHM